MMLFVWVTPQRCGRKVDRTLCLGKECRIDRTLYSTLLNSTHFFSVVDRTLTHFFWSTGWEVISNRCSHSSMIQSLRFIFIIFQTLHVDVKSWQETRSRNILIKTPQKLTFVRDQIFIFTVVNSGTWRVWSQERRQFLHFGPASQYKTNYFY